MIIRNTFLNAQMGQVVQYNQNQPHRDRTLRWIDLKEPGKQGSGETPKVQNEGSPTKSGSKSMPPLAKLIPVQDTVEFKVKVTNHHKKVQRDITSCLRGTRLNRS